MRSARVPALLILLAPAAVQAADAPRYTVETLAEGVHAVLYDPEIEVEGNTLVVVNDDHVVVVDSNAGVTTAKLTIAEIRRLTPKPVRFVVNTHWHDDHVFGNQAYAEAFPGVQFIAHPLTRLDIVDHAFANNAFVLDLLEADVARIGGYLETGIGRDGRAMTGEQRARAKRAYDRRVEMLADRKALVAVPPAIDVADEMTLARGGREIRIRFLGRGNTRGDLVVYLPKEGILATGDLVVAPIPYATNVYVQDWIGTLDRLMAVPATTIVPGHGPVMRDWSYVRRVKGALEETLAAVAAAKHEGLTLPETMERVQLPELRERFVAGVETRRAGYEAFFRTSLVRNAWEELDAAVMAAARERSMVKVADGVYRYGGGAAGASDPMAIVNAKDVVLVNAAPSSASARAMVRALRELTDKRVRFVVIPDWQAADPGAVAVLREVYAQAHIVSNAASGPDITVADVMTLHRDGREILVRRAAAGRLEVSLPKEEVTIGAGR